MGFGEVFGESWRDYKANFKEISKVQFMFYVLPYLIVAGIIVFLFFSMGIYDGVKDLYNMFISGLQEMMSGVLVNPTPSLSPQNSNPLSLVFAAALELFYKSLPFLLIGLVLTAISYLFTLYGYSGIITSSVKSKKFTFSDVTNSAGKNFGKIVGLIAFTFIIATVYLLALVLVSGLLGIVGVFGILAGIVVAVWVSIGWSFALFFIVAEGKGVFKSLASSWAFVKGRWWKTFGYIILFFLITLAFRIVLGILQQIIEIIVLGSYGLPQTLDLNILSLTFEQVFNYMVITNTISEIIRLISNFLIVPLGFLFLKNLYFTWKKQKN